MVVSRLADDPGSEHRVVGRQDNPEDDEAKGAELPNWESRIIFERIKDLGEKEGTGK